MAKVFEPLTHGYKTITFVADALSSAGDFLTKGNTNGFTLVDVTQEMIDDSEEVTLIVEIASAKAAKKTGETWAEGQAVYYDSSTQSLSNVAGTLVLCGRAKEAVASTEVEARIIFDGKAAFLKA